jgi:thiaminase/transcriptional activator TenA
MPESFSQRLWRRADAVWEAQHRHPFVRGVGDGTLDLEAFKFWLRQDYLFLVEYARVLGLAAAKAPDLETMTRFAGLLNETLRVEMGLHRSYAAEFGISEEELEREEMAPATRAYTDFLVRTAAVGDFAGLVAALTPCMWGFCEIAQRLAAGPQPADAPARPAGGRYRRWIEMYSSPEFAELAAWCRDLLDRLAEGLGAEEQQRLEDAFLTSSRYEYLFWEAAYRREGWPV